MPSLYGIDLKGTPYADFTEKSLAYAKKLFKDRGIDKGSVRLYLLSSKGPEKQTAAEKKLLQEFERKVSQEMKDNYEKNYKSKVRLALTHAKMKNDRELKNQNLEQFFEEYKVDDENELDVDKFLEENNPPVNNAPVVNNDQKMEKAPAVEEKIKEWHVVDEEQQKNIVSDAAKESKKKTSGKKEKKSSEQEIEDLEQEIEDLKHGEQINIFEQDEVEEKKSENIEQAVQNDKKEIQKPEGDLSKFSFKSNQERVHVSLNSGLETIVEGENDIEDEAEEKKSDNIERVVQNDDNKKVEAKNEEVKEVKVEEVKKVKEEEKAKEKEVKEIDDKSKASGMLNEKEEKDLMAYEKSLNQETNTMQVIRNSQVSRNNSQISESEQEALLEDHELHNQNEQALRSHFKDGAEEKEINIPELIKNQVRLEAGELSPTERMQHYQQIVRMKDAEGDQYSRKLAEYRTKVAESAGKEFDKEHKDHTKLSFLNKTANAIEKIMCAMTKNPLGLVMLLVAAVNAPLLMVGLLGFMAWKRKHPDMGYQKALQAQQQREIQDMRQKLADFHGVDIKDIPESEAKKVLREEYVRNKTNEAVLEKLEKESKKQVDKAADAYAKDIKKQGIGKYSGKEIKEHYRRELAKDPVFELEGKRDKNLKIAMQSVKPKSHKTKTL